MEETIVLYKPQGMTPLSLIQRFQTKYPEYSKTKIGYAGRLDPMAEGLMIVLAGEENKKRKEYELLPKTYECEFVFGIETDTYDALGIIKQFQKSADYTDFESELSPLLSSFRGSFIQSYPPYSAVRINGKSLFYYARHNLLDTISIPQKKVSIYSITKESYTLIEKETLLTNITNNIGRVEGDFRQKDILTKWRETIPLLPPHLALVRIRVESGSGTYMRSLAHSLGQQMNRGAIALTIKRTQIGRYTLKDAISIE